MGGSHILGKDWHDILLGGADGVVAAPLNTQQVFEKSKEGPLMCYSDDIQKRADKLLEAFLFFAQKDDPFFTGLNHSHADSNPRSSCGLGLLLSRRHPYANAYAC